MNDTERKMHIAEMAAKFYRTLESILTNPGSAMQKDGIDLIADINNIIAEIDKLEDPSSIAIVRTRMELAKHRLSQAMMTTEVQGE